MMSPEKSSPKDQANMRWGVDLNDSEAVGAKIRELASKGGNSAMEAGDLASLYADVHGTQPGKEKTEPASNVIPLETGNKWGVDLDNDRAVQEKIAKLASSPGDKNKKGWELAAELQQAWDNHQNAKKSGSDAPQQMAA